MGVPVVESLHFIGMALSVGTIAIVDLRLLGIAMPRRSAGELAADLHRWTLIGLTLMLITGSMMFSADAVNSTVVLRKTLGFWNLSAWNSPKS